MYSVAFWRENVNFKGSIGASLGFLVFGAITLSLGFLKDKERCFAYADDADSTGGFTTNREAVDCASNRTDFVEEKSYLSHSFELDFFVSGLIIMFFGALVGSAAVFFKYQDGFFTRVSQQEAAVGLPGQAAHAGDLQEAGEDDGVEMSVFSRV